VCYALGAVVSARVGACVTVFHCHSGHEQPDNKDEVINLLFTLPDRDVFHTFHTYSSFPP
jgi:hypothetical protein